MKDIYLSINYGGEERFELVRQTILVSYPYFKKIRVLNFGSDKKSEKFIKLTSDIPNLEVVNLGKFYHSTITEDLVRFHTFGIPDGDWISVLDSDWRFPEIFLKNMHKEVELCEKEGYNCIFSYQIGHSLVDKIFSTTYTERIFGYTQTQINNITTGMSKDPNSYGFPCLQKINKKMLWIDGFLGNHCYFIPVPYLKKHVPYMYHLHIREFDDHAYCSTMLFQSWWYIGHNVFPVNDHIEIMKSEEYRNIEKFKDAHNCFTSEHLREMMKNESFLEELKQLFLSFKDTKIFGCKQMYNLASQFDMKIWTNTGLSSCDGVCCSYNGKKIFDI